MMHDIGFAIAVLIFGGGFIFGLVWLVGGLAWVLVSTVAHYLASAVRWARTGHLPP